MLETRRTSGSVGLQNARGVVRVASAAAETAAAFDPFCQTRVLKADSIASEADAELVKVVAENNALRADCENGNRDSAFQSGSKSSSPLHHLFSGSSLRRPLPRNVFCIFWPVTPMPLTPPNRATPTFARPHVDAGQTANAQRLRVGSGDRAWRCRVTEPPALLPLGQRAVIGGPRLGSDVAVAAEARDEFLQIGGFARSQSA